MFNRKSLSRERSISVDVEDSSTLLRRLDRSAHCHYCLPSVCFAVDETKLLGGDTALKQLIKAFCTCAQVSKRGMFCVIGFASCILGLSSGIDNHFNDTGDQRKKCCPLSSYHQAGH